MRLQETEISQIVSNRRVLVVTVEAALCLPVLVLIWLLSYEVVHMQSLKQQRQLLSSTAATRILESTKNLDVIEDEIVDLADQLNLEGCVVELQRIDKQIVEAVVEIDYSQNSVLGSILKVQDVRSVNYSYRIE